MQEILENVGLTAAEANIYLMLLETGASLAGKISRDTGIHRRSVYDAIERLIQKGLVSYIKRNNRKFFEAADPSRLRDIIKEKEENVNSVMDKLKLLQQMSQDKNETLFFRGSTALKTVLDDQLEVGEEIKIFGASHEASRIVKFYFPHYHKARVKKNIKVKMIFNEEARNNPDLKKIPLAEIRFVPRHISSSAGTNIYGKNVSIITWKKDPVALIIREEEIAKTYDNYFSLLWQIAKK